VSTPDGQRVRPLPRCPVHRGSGVGGPYGVDDHGSERWKCVPRRGSPHAFSAVGFRSGARRLGFEGWGIVLSGPVAVFLLLPPGPWRGGAAAGLATVSGIAQTRRIIGYGPWLPRYEALFGQGKEHEQPPDATP
jgi:hypothetical protein